MAKPTWSATLMVQPWKGLLCWPHLVDTYQVFEALQNVDVQMLVGGGHACRNPGESRYDCLELQMIPMKCGAKAR